jgi:predicted permease
MFHVARHWLRAAFRRDALDREMTDEMRQHLERATALLVSRGMSHRAATAAARREFGNVAWLQEEGRAARGAMWLESARADVRYALRGLRSSPVFATVAILSLAIGIGANTAIFSLINAVMLKSLPVERPSELVQLGIHDAGPITAEGNAFFTNPLWEATRDNATGFTGFAASGLTQFDLADGGESRFVIGSYVNGDFFTTLGVHPGMGRLFTRADDVRGCAETVVISDGFWRSELGARADVINTTLRLSNRPFTIIGVAPAGFNGVDVGTELKLYVPLCRRGEHELASRSSWWLRVVGRLSRGTLLQQANARLAAASRGIFGATIPETWDAKSKAAYASQQLHARLARNGFSNVRSQYSTALFALMGMVGLILLISCANVANLLLARGAARGRETAIRIAIGASRGRLVRQNLTEGLVLAAIGAAVGTGLAQWASQLLVNMLGRSNPVALDLSLDLRVLGFTTALAVATVIMCTLAPAWRATRIDPQSAMKSGGRGTNEAPSRFAIGKSLVVVQCALALILVVGAGLLVGSFTRLTRVDPGFRADGVLLVSVNMARAKLEPAGYRAIHQRLLADVRAQPGLQAASNSDLTPVGGATWNEEVVAEGGERSSGNNRVAWFNRVSDGFFRTMGTPLVAGRDFGVADDVSGPAVAIMNRAAATRYFGTASPIGRVIHLVGNSTEGPPIRVVGVVDNSKYHDLREVPTAIIYLPTAQDTETQSSTALEIRIAQSPSAAIAQVKSVVERIDPRAGLKFTALSDQVERTLARERMLAALSGFFGALALLLAMIGLYGVMAYMVARRRVEIGIRVALGAARTRIVRLVLGDVVRLMVLGILLGGIGAVALSRVLESFLYGVTPDDPQTILMAIGALSAAALLAGAIPARRAATMEPLEALRED